MKASFTHVNPKANKGIKTPKLGKGNSSRFEGKLPKKLKAQPPTQSSLADFLKKK
ncbi:hypothetical protein [uncultured Maritalea sp.]|jgi:hypothetical protein|uniref:hypothetical protein n=1 Tax=uncultured Maritalea sp. TaxID=757249 RepID=UPI0026210E51|nr:hypothetical protein [uncultured Maritalea sp.]